jgi:hypothetical protein
MQSVALIYALTATLYFQSQGGHTLQAMPKKSAVIPPTKKPAPLLAPIPPIPVASSGVIPPLKPGQRSNTSGRISKPKPVRRAKG